MERLRHRNEACLKFSFHQCHRETAATGAGFVLQVGVDVVSASERIWSSCQDSTRARP
jgi:hypothetical protein